MRPGPENRWFFIHVMKTGGNTVQALIERNVDKRHLYPNRSFGNPTRSKTNLKFFAEIAEDGLLDQVHVFTPHLPACVRELLPYPTSAMTVLREPVSRTVSWLRQRQRLHTPDASLEEVYDDPWRPAFADNHQTRMLSMRLSDQAVAFWSLIDVDQQRLDEARQRLDDTDIVGFQEDLGGFLDVVCDRLGFDIRRAASRNVAGGEVSISASLRRRIIDDNSYDLALYEYARRTRGWT